MVEASGAIRGDVHIFPVRVYYEDTDVAGIVYYANYLKYAERARTEFLRLLGFDQSVLLDHHGIGFAVRRCEIDYRLPARLDDALDVHSRMRELGGASLRAEQVVYRGEHALVRLRVRLACMDRGGRPVRIPSAIHDRLKPYFPVSQPTSHQEHESWNN